MDYFTKLGSWWAGFRWQFSVLAALGFSSALCVGMLVLRAWHYESPGHNWLVWNLFLAWLPALGAFVVYNLGRLPTRLRWWPMAGIAALWLLFLPNAAYLITDIIHLKAHPRVPLWFDLITLVAFAWTGTFLGMVSLSLMQELVRRAVGAAGSWFFALGVMGLSGFGIYFGRVLRWNSWDVFFEPMTMLRQVWYGVTNPLAHLQTLAFAGLFTLLLCAVYLMVLSFTHLQLEHRRE